MPKVSDEQRKQFEEVAERVGAHEEFGDPTWEDWYYDPPEYDFAWKVYSSRDAEVQALREQVDHAKRIFQSTQVRSGYCVCGDTPERHGLYAEACQYTDRGQWESELWLKRAALAGSEVGEEDE